MNKREKKFAYCCRETLMVSANDYWPANLGGSVKRAYNVVHGNKYEASIGISLHFFWAQFWEKKMIKLI